MIKNFFFGSQARDETQTETMLQYTNRVGLLTNTFYVPPIALLLTLQAETNANGELFGKMRFATTFAKAFLLTLGVTHYCFYMMQHRLPARVK